MIKEIFAICLISLFLTPLSVSAQTDAPGETNTQFSDRQVDDFATTYLKVVQIQNKEQKNLAKDASQEEVKKFLSRMNAKIEKAVNAQSGMDMDLYNKIMNQLDKDPALMKRVQKKTQNLRN